MGLVLTAEPPCGFYIRARFVGHHTAGWVWHRDDAEGHPPGGAWPDPRVWWSHEGKRWESWKDILHLLEDKAAIGEPMVLEPLFAPPQSPGCRPYGMHDERCAPLPKTEQ